MYALFFFFQAEDGIRDVAVTGVQTCALPICRVWSSAAEGRAKPLQSLADSFVHFRRSEEHTSELQSRLHLVCRLLLEKKKANQTTLQNLENRKHLNDATVTSLVNSPHADHKH